MSTAEPDPQPVPPVGTPEAITEAELAEALKAYSALGMSPTGFAKALFRDVRIARPADGATADAPGSGTDDTGRDLPADPERSREQSAASWRERAEAAEGKLAEIETHCRTKANWFDSQVAAGRILAIIGTEEESREH